MIISIIFGVNSWITSAKQNSLQEQFLVLEKEANKFELKKGEILLMGLLGRYFTIQLNCWEVNGKIRTDEISIEQYIYELKQLNQDVNALVTNPFYIEALEKHPEINLLWIYLRRFIIQSEHDHKMSVNPQLFDKFYDLYFKIKKEISDKDMFKNQFYISTDDAAKFLKIEIPKIGINKS